MSTDSKNPTQLTFEDLKSADSGVSDAVGSASTDESAPSEDASIASVDHSLTVDSPSQKDPHYPSADDSDRHDQSTAEAVIPYESELVDAPWYGLALSHRRLIDALQSGWLLPPPEVNVHRLGAGRLVQEPVEMGKHTILVRLCFDAKKLQDIHEWALRGETKVTPISTEFGPEEDEWFWPGALPTYAIRELSVSTEEERIRINGFVKQLSNVEFPVAVNAAQKEDVVQGSLPISPPSIKQPDKQSLIEIPTEMDAIQGAMAMAVWSVPRIDPWLDLLVASLSEDREQLPELSSNVDATWWCEPPWSNVHANSTLSKGPITESAREANDSQEALWRAAVQVLGDKKEGPVRRSRDLAECIAKVALNVAPKEVSDIRKWLDETCRILRAETTIRPNVMQTFPVGLAVQLVLARQEPVQFKNWPRELPDLPPGVWWSAATLCGLNHGYKRLDTYFRGETSLQEVLSVHALRTSSSQLNGLAWPNMEDVLGWRKTKDGFELYWGQLAIAHKSSTFRSAWYGADLKDERNKKEAIRVARELNWPCASRRIRLSDKSSIIVNGFAVIDLFDGKQAAEIKGELDIQLPISAEIEPVLDDESFRKHIATKSGRIPGPPAQKNTVETEILVNSPFQKISVPGLKYVRGFLTETEEGELVERIDEDPSKWSKELKRHVQHYGWRYEYKSRQVDRRDRIGPLPDWALKFAYRLVEKGLVPELPDQLIVNEYQGAQGISRHVDSEASFDDHIAMISLLETWEMVFEKGKEKRVVPLEKGSVAVMSGPSRTEWTHMIPARKTEPGQVMRNGKVQRILRERRLSLTFRKVKNNPNFDSQRRIK